MTKTNFDFLIKIDKNLSDIIIDAERLYRGDFFDQCIGQTRRYAERICRDVLGENRTSEITFDEMLATLKDKSNGLEEEKEFIDDLYFLKKQGNLSVHGAKVEKNATMALECLQRAFEVGLNYAVFYKKAPQKLLQLHYDAELLITGEPSKKSLSEKYLEAKEQATKTSPKPKKKTTKNKPKKDKPQVSVMKSVPKKTEIPPFWIIVGISLVAALFAVIYILL